MTSQPHLMPANLVFRAIADEPMHLITSPEEQGDDPIALLKTRPFIRFDRTAVVGALIDNWLLSQRIQVSEAMELDSPEAIASMVHANLGVSIVPNVAVKPYDAVPVKHVSLGPDAPKRTLGLIYRNDQIKARALDEVFEAIVGVVEGSPSAGRGER